VSGFRAHFRENTSIVEDRRHLWIRIHPAALRVGKQAARTSPDFCRSQRLTRLAHTNRLCVTAPRHTQEPGDSQR
jgi:hypothetical protein